MGALSDLRSEAGAELEALELDLLLEALVRRYGFDYRLHERDALKRKLYALMHRRGLPTLSSLQDRALHDPATASALLRALSVPPATLFDDPQEALQLRGLLGACLRGAALPRVWLADCAGAEQAWTLAVLLEEEGLLAQTEIHATVGSDELLAEAAACRIPLERLAQCQRLYEYAGGTASLSVHFQIEDGHAVLLPRLRSRISWAQYNLVTDASFNEFQLIVCRRALPDFGPLLRQRVLRLFHASLAPLGILGLDRPLASDDAHARHYQQLLPQQAWYKRTA